MIIPSVADLGLLELSNSTPLRIQIHPTGALFALRYDSILINQYLSAPTEDGLFRLIVQWKSGGEIRSQKLVGAGLCFSSSSEAACWECEPQLGLRWKTVLSLDASSTAWRWTITVENATGREIEWSVFLAQDLGLADEGAVRNNEAYTSHYIDLRAGTSEHGWVVFARQNQAMSGGRRPWLAGGCFPRAAAYATDGEQFFGRDHRLVQTPRALVDGALPSKRLQYEMALVGLQSETIATKEGASGVAQFVFQFIPDHPAATTDDEASVLGTRLVEPVLRAPFARAVRTSLPLFVGAGWLHGEEPEEADLVEWHAGQRFHEERDQEKNLLSFFLSPDGHVVTRRKEAGVRRPHGHILRSGRDLAMTADQFGITCYASGIFSAQAYFGNTSFLRLTSVVRNALNVSRSHGQRIFVRVTGEWMQLGVPSTFLMRPGEVVWHYRMGVHVLRIAAACAADHPCARLRIEVLSGPELEFLVTHHLVVGATEYEHRGRIEPLEAEGVALLHPAAESLMGRCCPSSAFLVATGDVKELAEQGGDSLFQGGEGATHWCLKSRPTKSFTVLQIGLLDKRTPVERLLGPARTWAQGCGASAEPPSPPIRLHSHKADSIRRVDTVLPWLAHNAWIHFSAPHGLEQYGGAAWGVRDVTQGSMEWLLASGNHSTARGVLQTVFAQQYENGTWPQWFMHPPFRFIQQNHSHGDVCFWPLKAVADYVEATDDFSLLREEVDFLSAQGFVEVRKPTTILEHCDRVVAHVESRFIAGTALVNYGDGDWDDTLQPADPALRTSMVSAWTVALSYHTFRLLAEVYRRADEPQRHARLLALLERIRTDFNRHLVPDGVVAGFWIKQAKQERCLLHPTDAVTGIRYRLLPMTRSILAELFTPEQAERHLDLIREHLVYPDGARLMSEPARYCGGREVLFKRADTAANVGREIGLQYVHAHLRYLEALAKVGRATELWEGLQQINPVELCKAVPNAAPRQANVYFSSSDADFGNREEAAEQWQKLKKGDVTVWGGWRLYSSGPGIILRLVRHVVLGVREHFDRVVVDPVLPEALDGLTATVVLWGKAWNCHYRVKEGGPVRNVSIKGSTWVTTERETNPYRLGGIILPRSVIEKAAEAGETQMEIQL